jgi:hypothetical protein
LLFGSTALVNVFEEFEEIEDISKVYSDAAITEK